MVGLACWSDTNVGSAQNGKIYSIQEIDKKEAISLQFDSYLAR